MNTANLQLQNKEFSSFYKKNPGFNILQFNFHDAKAIKELDWKGVDEKEVLNKLAAYQRLLRIYPDEATAQILLADGFNSAQKITSISQSQFVKEFAGKLNSGGNETGRQIYVKAMQVKSKTMHLLANIHSVVASPFYRSMNINHINDDITGYFESLPNYQDIFGTLDYCDCEECKSIFGPAAYFTDLLRIIDKAITRPCKDSIHQAASKTLDERRPDLAKIPLTCAMTNNMIPYLKIVNEILENTVGSLLKTGNVYQALAGRFYPFNLPFNLPLEQIRNYLAIGSLGLKDVYNTFSNSQMPGLASARELLDLSVEELQNIKPCDPPSKLPAVLSENYGLTIKSNVAGLDHLEKFLSQTGLSRKKFSDLLRQNLSEREIFDITGEYSSTEKGDTLTFTQVGSNVSLTYGPNGSYEARASINRNILKGSLVEVESESSNLIAFEFTFSDDAKSFTGFYTSRSNGSIMKSDWSGQRTSKFPAVTGEIPHGFFINKVLGANKYLYTALNNSNPAQEFEQIMNLSLPTLDTLNRFIRLASKTGWEYHDLNWLLTTLNKQEIDDSVVQNLGAIKLLQEKYNIDLQVIAALYYNIRTIGEGNEFISQTPFDFIFNSSGTTNTSGSRMYHPKAEGSQYVSPLYRDNPLPWNYGVSSGPSTEAEQRAAIIVSNIPASTDSIIDIATSVFGAANDSIPLTVENLSVLYRHTVFPNILGTAVPNYLKLLNLLEIKEKSGSLPKTLSLSEITKIVFTFNWMKNAGINVFQADYICNGNLSDYVDPGYNPENLPQFLSSFSQFISDTLLVQGDLQANGITKETAEQCYGALMQQEFLDNVGVVIKNVNKTSPDFSGIKSLSFAQVKYLNNVVSQKQKDQYHKFGEQVASFLGTKSDQMLAIINGAEIVLNLPYSLRNFITCEMFNVDSSEVITGSDLDPAKLVAVFKSEKYPLTNNLAIIKQSENNWMIKDNFIRCIYYARQTSGSKVTFYRPSDSEKNKVPAAVASELMIFSQYLLLSQVFSLKAAELSLVFECNSAFGFNNKIFSLSNLGAIYLFRQMISAFQDNKNGLVDYLITANSANPPSIDSLVNQLCAVTGWDETGCKILWTNELFFGSTGICKTVEDVNRLKQVFDLSNKMGADITFMLQLNKFDSLPIDSNWDLYRNTASRLRADLIAHTADNQVDILIKKLDGPIEEDKRNALMATAIWKMGMDNSRQLYEYLLIDVDMSACQSISYIKQGLNSAQLYLQRCRLNLEPGVTISTDDIPDIYWEWLMNYRVWEANRKIFLYPENYIDPTLRKSKTALFKKLENTLQQSEVTEKTVAKAYKQYMDDFRQLAKLQYCDAYHCIVHDKERGALDTLFLFAHTQTEPYKYYYISCEERKTWSEWKEINISISASSLTPVYAFNKLFIFWVEQKSLKENDTDNKKVPVYKAAIKYSFNDFSGNWSQPQVLVDDIIINAATADNSYGPFNPALFNQTKPWWSKVGAVAVNQANYLFPANMPEAGEKICIYIGPVADPMNMTGTPAMSGAFSDPTTDIEKFKQEIYRADIIRKQIASKSVNGQFPIAGAITINSDLDVTYLLDQNEYKLFEINNFSADSAPVFKAGLRAGKMPFSSSGNSLLNNYMGNMGLDPVNIERSAKANANSFKDIVGDQSGHLYKMLTTPPNDVIGSDGTVKESALKIGAAMYASIAETDVPAGRRIRNRLFELYYGTPILFSNVVKAQSSLIPVKNQPGMMLFGNFSDTFLLIAGKFSKLNDDLKLNYIYHSVRTNSFVSDEVPLSESERIFTTLQNPPNQLIDIHGIVNTSASQQVAVPMLAQALGVTETIAQEVKDVLLAGGPASMLYASGSYKVVFPSSFIMPGISELTSLSIFQILSTPPTELISPNGIINEYKVEHADVNMLSSLLALSVDVTQKVINVLKNPGVNGFQKSSSEFKADDNIYTLKFNTERISTNAIDHLSKSLFAGGIESLLSLESQQPRKNVNRLFTQLDPGSNVVSPDELSGEQVSFSGPYGNYYWEIFFHAPFLVSNMLNTNKQFREAEQWLQFIFNPTIPAARMNKGSFVNMYITPAESERIYGALTTPPNQLINENGQVLKNALTLSLGFYMSALALTAERAQEVKNILTNNYTSSSTSHYWQFLKFRNHELETLKDMIQNPVEIHAYETEPFDPHAIARLRIGAYEKTIVMAYIKNLLDWGDYEFSQYTWESITAATMLYVYAYDLLGKKPESLGKCRSEFPASFIDIKSMYANSKEGIPVFLINLENILGSDGNDSSSMPASKAFNDLEAYFCVPENEQFTGYWDKVQQRLYQIRHCLNIKGQKQPLPLFQPPINPMQLVKAAAAGNNAISIVDQLLPDVPNYKFKTMLEKTNGMLGTLSQLGNQLLSILEKNDSEALALLRSTHEGNILNMTLMIKQKQIDDLNTQLAALQENKKGAVYRNSHFKTLVENGLNVFEAANLVLMAEAMIPQAIANGIRGVTIAGYLAPNIFGFSDGGMKFGDAINAGAQISDSIAGMMTHLAGILATMGGYERRNSEWEFQEQLAQYEMDQVDQQIAGCEVKISIAEQELAITKKQIEQSDEEENFLKTKFTNKDLYQWMISRISSVYFQSYKLVLNMALSTQAAYNFELDREDKFINFGYWDSLYKGLLAAEGLTLSLNQMEKAFLENNTRRLEIEKTVSIRKEFPLAFAGFKWGQDGATKGNLNFMLSQKMFDFDFPGHYCRKIKSVSITVPAIVGPYDTLKATLTQNSNFVLNKPDTKAVDYLIYRTSYNPSGNEPPAPQGGEIRENWVPNQQIAVSSGIDDAGLFVLNFEDERYLPFEGTGAVSLWTFNMPPSTNRVNFDSISDIIIKIKYTALDGGIDFGKAVEQLYAKSGSQYQDINFRSYEMKQAFSSSWFKLFTEAPQNSKSTLLFNIDPSIVLPNLKNVVLQNCVLRIEVAGQQSAAGNNYLDLQIGDNTPLDVNITDTQSDAIDLSNQKDPFAASWKLIFDLSNCPDSIMNKTTNTLDSTKLENIIFVIAYKSDPF